VGIRGAPFPRIRVAAIIIQDGRILLIRHKKGPHTYWLLPGGGVEYGEALDEALRRELREETNLDINVQDLAFVNDSVAPDGSRHIVNLYFFAQAVGGSLAVTVDDRVKEARWFPPDALQNLVVYPDIREELKTLTADGSGERRVYLGTRWKDLA